MCLLGNYLGKSYSMVIELVNFIFNFKRMLYNSLNYTYPLAGMFSES